MALNIKDEETERLAAEIAQLTGDTKTGAIRSALRREREKLRAGETRQQRWGRMRRFLEDEIWSEIPATELGVPLSKEEREDILGYGPEGV